MSKSTSTIALTLTIKEPTEYVDRTLATASWWDKYTLLPGTYRVQWEIDPYSPHNRIERGYVEIDAILDESYRVNRVFTASSAHHETDLGKRTTKRLSLYPWVWMQYAGKPSTEPQIWGGIVDYAAVVEAPVDHIEISDPEDPMGIPAYGGRVDVAHTYLEDGTYRGYGHGKGHEGQAVLVVADGTSTAVWL